MFKVNIKKQDVITNSAQFETQVEVDAWIKSCEADKAFGMPEHTVVHPEIIDPETGEILQHEGVEIVPTEYTIEIIENYVDQEKLNAEARAYLASTDYLVIRAMEDSSKPVPEEIKQARQLARDKVK